MSYIPPAQIRSYKELGRPGCLLLCHREEGERRGDGGNLSLMEGDRCLLRSPDFIEDIEDAISACFDNASNDEEIKSLILSRFNLRRPVDSVGDISVIRKGPQF